MSEPMKTIKLWKSYVKRGAPSNGFGSCTGYGWTKEQASDDAGHFNNQAPWEGFKLVTISDLDYKPKWASKDEQHAWEIIGWIDETLTPTKRGQAILDLYNQNKYASAVIAYFAAIEANELLVKP